MNKEVIIGITGILIGYFIIRALLRSRKPQEDILSDILTDEKYKVKGQWGK